MAGRIVVSACSVRVVSASLANVRVDIEEAALVLGSGRVGAFRRVVMPNIRNGILAAFILGVLAAAAPLPAESPSNWPQFRGPTGLGYTTERNLPLTWNAKAGEHIRWKALLPKSDNAYSSPIVWGAIAVYWFCLKRRYREAENELNRLRSSEAAAGHE